MFVEGVIRAIGTEEEPITFDAVNSEEWQRWCGVRVSEYNSHIFSHCHFERAYRRESEDGSLGAITVLGGPLRVENCEFVDCAYGVCFGDMNVSQFIYNNKFWDTEGRYIGSLWAAAYRVNIPENCDPYPYLNVARNTINGDVTELFFHYSSVHVLINTIYNRFIGSGSQDRSRLDAIDRHDRYANLLTRRRDEAVFSYGNIHINMDFMELGGSRLADTMGYIRRNRIINAYDIPYSLGGWGNCVISDNYIEDSDGIYISSSYCDSKAATMIYNNVLINPLGRDIDVETAGRIWNNAIYNASSIRMSSTIDKFYNNVIIGTIAWATLVFNGSTEFTNNIFIGDEEIHVSCSPDSLPVFRNNYLSEDILDQVIDGGGNIIGADPGLADPANGDFSLVEGSPCIDAGVSDNLWFDYDALNNFRIADGNGDGIAEVDIGAWERASSYRGCIEGYVFEEDGVTPLDIAELKLTGMLPEWSDSTGYFRFDCGPGEFTLTADRFYYDAQTVGTYNVSPGEMVFVSVIMNALDVTDPEEYLQPYMLLSSNYPNPFNPTTTIRYSIPADGKVELSIYNIRGQLVKRLVNEPLEAGEHQVVWDGKNERSQPVASGIYFYRLRSGAMSRTGKMLLMK